MKSYILCLVMVVVLNTFEAEVCQGHKIGADRMSTFRIISALCQPGNHNQKISQEFYRCYDTAPGKREFSTCQIRAFGCLLNNERAIDYLCQNLNPQNVNPSSPSGGGSSKYTSCLKEEFEKASLDLIPAVTIINICQAKVVGIL